MTDEALESAGGSGSEEFILFFWVATFCEWELRVRVARRLQVRMPVLVRKWLGVFRVGLVELWRWFWVAIFFVRELGLVVAAVFRQALVLRVA